MKTKLGTHIWTPSSSLKLPLPKRQQWVAFQLQQQLLKKQSSLISIVFRMGMVACMAGYVPTIFLLFWLGLSFVVIHWISRLNRVYAQLTNNEQQTVTSSMSEIFRQYKQACYFNNAVWGICPFLYMTWLPHLNQMFCIVLLMVMAAMTLIRSHPNRIVMHHGSMILVVSQFIALLFQFVSTAHADRNYAFYIFWLFVLPYIAHLLIFAGNQMNISTRRYLHAIYTNLLTIRRMKKAEQQRSGDLQLLWHDLRAPQSAILTLLRTDEENIATSNLSRATINTRIAAQVDETLNLADDFIWLVRAESDTLQYNEVDMVQLAKEVIDRVWPLAQAKNIQLICDLNELPVSQDKRQAVFESNATSEDVDPALWLHIEPRLMGRALSNLIENAIKYSPKNTKIVITLRLKGDENAMNVVKFPNKNPRIAEISIQDQGYGISVKNLPRIFDSYTRFSSSATEVENTLSDALPGHGLGLRLVKTVIDAHKGSIKCESVLGKGSVFTIKLPCE